MKRIEAYFNPETQCPDFRLVDAVKNALGEFDLRVQVKAVSVNPVDTKVASSLKTLSSQPIVLGWDASGIVVETGSQVKNYKIGDEVYYAGSIQRAGSNTQFQIVDERIVGKKPKSLSFPEAAALPLTTITAYEAIFDHLQVQAHEQKSILILGAAGGVGSIAIQLLKHLTALTVIGTASRPESEKWIRDAGIDEVIDHKKDIGEQLKSIGYPEVDYILCFNDTDFYFKHFARWVKPMGKIVSIVETSGPVDLGPLKSKSIGFSWEFMFTRSMFQTPDQDEQGKILNRVSELVDAHQIKTTVALDLGEMSVKSLQSAHEILKSGRMIGKIVMGELKG